VRSLKATRSDIGWTERMTTSGAASAIAALTAAAAPGTSPAILFLLTLAVGAARSQQVAKAVARGIEE